jgi:hypothetical protein
MKQHYMGQFKTGVAINRLERGISLIKIEPKCSTQPYNNSRCVSYDDVVLLASKLRNYGIRVPEA